MAKDSERDRIHIYQYPIGASLNTHPIILVAPTGYQFEIIRIAAISNYTGNQGAFCINDRITEGPTSPLTAHHIFCIMAHSAANPGPSIVVDYMDGKGNGYKTKYISICAVTAILFTGDQFHLTIQYKLAPLTEADAVWEWFGKGEWMGGPL